MMTWTIHENIMPRLVCYPVTNETLFAELSAPEITIGRSPENAIRLTGRFIYRRHAALRREPDGRYRLFDLMSRNLVMLHRQPVPAEGAELHHGDEFTVADVRCRYRDCERAPADRERTVNAIVEGNRVDLALRRYLHMSAASDFADDWEADVVPLLSTFRNSQVTVDLRDCQLSWAKLLEKLRAAGQVLKANGCTWHARLSPEMLMGLAEIWQKPVELIVEDLEKLCFVQVDR